ncbi:MAG: hypothetical protein E6R03_02190 [Hyphomicrobiaceae bacterium]|nr:MAG: hypothetical protein E6R03_02190 [Hyphomicrobiaceae bacterium]
MNLTFTVQGAPLMSQDIQAFNAFVSDWSNVWPLVERIYLDIMLTQFETEGARSGARWKALSPGYAKWKEANYGQLPILVLTGTMKTGLLGSGPTSLREITPTTFRMGTSANRKGFYYPVAHQEGGSTPGRPPVRRIYDFSLDDYNRFVSRIFRYFNDGIEHTGRWQRRGSSGARSIQAS